MSKVIRRKEVSERTGLSRSTIYELIRKQQFPTQIRLTERSVGWLESDIEKWIQSKKNS